jgi:hypothetical protein
MAGKKKAAQELWPTTEEWDALEALVRRVGTTTVLQGLALMPHMGLLEDEGRKLLSDAAKAFAPYDLRLGISKIGMMRAVVVVQMRQRSFKKMSAEQRAELWKRNSDLSQDLASFHGRWNAEAPEPLRSQLNAWFEKQWWRSKNLRKKAPARKRRGATTRKP